MQCTIAHLHTILYNNNSNYHIEGSLREKALVSTVEFFLASKVPAIDKVSDNISSWSLVLVTPVLDIHSHCGYVSLGVGVGTRVLLDQAMEECCLSSFSCSNYHHLHVIVRYTSSVPRLKVTDDSLSWPIQ